MSTQSKANLWDVACSKLSGEQQERLKAGLVFPVRFDELKAAIDKTREGAASRKLKAKTREYLSKIAAWLQKFIAVGDSIVQFDTGHAALPWAALRLVLQVMVNDTTRAAEFAKGLEQVAFYVYDCTMRENLYLSDGMVDGRKDLEGCIIALYTKILRFLLETREFFESNTKRRLLSSVFKTGDEVMQLLGPVAQKASQILIISGRIDAANHLSTRTSIQGLSESQAISMTWLRQRVEDNDIKMRDLTVSIQEETLGHFDALQVQLSRIEDGLDQFKENDQTNLGAPQGDYEEYERLKVLQWLSPIPFHRHHRTVYDEVLQGTGSWFLQDSEYTQWKDSDHSAMLWLHGIPGSGKSKLTSLAIQEALKSKHESSSTLYFYCSRTPAEPERAKAEDIFRCFVKQLSIGNIDDVSNEIPRCVLDKYKNAEANGFASGKLMLDESCNIISIFATGKAKTFIFIDALDECGDDARYRIIRAMNDTMAKVSTSVVKLLISSRDEPHLRTFFDEYKTYEICIDSSRNQQDIDNYVKDQLKTLIRHKRIAIAGDKPPSLKLQQFIVTKLCDGAQGMFRWVSLQLDYLCTLRTAQDIRNRLGRLPRDLSHSYDEVVEQNAGKYEPEDRRRLELALSLLLVPRRPDARVLSQLVFWEDGDEDDEDDDGVDTIDDPDLRDVERHSDKHRIDLGHREVIRLCFNLVVLDETTGVFRFAHTSVQEHFQNNEHKYGLISSSFARVSEHLLSILLSPYRHSNMGNFPLRTEHIKEDASNQQVPSPRLIQKPEITVNEIVEFDSLRSGIRNVKSYTTMWVEVNWAYYEHGREPTHEFSLLPELQDLAAQQPGDSLRPLVFFSACEFGLCQFVKAWLKAHPRLATICEPRPPGWTALLKACNGSGDRKIVEYLIENGADLTYSMDDGLNANALCTTIYMGRKDLALLMLDKGANPNAELPVKKSPGSVIPKPLHLAVRSPNDSLEFVRMLVEHGAEITVEDELGWTLIAAALAHSQVEVVAYLLEKGAAKTFDISRKLPALGPRPTVLQTTVERGNLLDKALEGKAPLPMIQLLIDRGLDIDQVETLGGEHIRALAPLHKAAMLQDPEVIDLLLKNGALINRHYSRGLTPLMYAIICEKLENARTLLAHGADLTICDEQGTDALMFAASRGYEGFVRLLIEYNANPNVRDAFQNTALYAAASGGHLSVIEVLTAFGAETDTFSIHGTSPLSVASENGYYQVVQLLLPETADINSQDGDGDTALSNAAYSGHEDIVDFLLISGAEIVPQQSGPHCPFLEEHERLLGFGKDALLRAWQNGHTAVARRILKCAASREPDGGYETALNWLERENAEEFQGWIDARIATAPENRPEAKKFAQVIWERETTLFKENKRRMSQESTRHEAKRVPNSE